MSLLEILWLLVFFSPIWLGAALFVTRGAHRAEAEESITIETVAADDRSRRLENRDA